MWTKSDHWAIGGKQMGKQANGEAEENYEERCLQGQRV